MSIRLPSSSILTLRAAGTFGRPGMGMTFPAIATTKPAPAESMALVTVMSKSFRAPTRVGLSVKDMGVFAMQIGNFPKPISSK